MKLNTQPPSVPVPVFPDAACADYPTAMFFPAPGTDGRDAKAVCAFCPHREPCLEWALETGEPWGVFGGMTAPERERLLRKKRAA